jgi:1,4-alpha-glucan branching enzyme
MSRDRGALALMLHSHMPYVEGFGTWPFGEEWLWEAVSTVYLPLAQLLVDTGAPITLGLTPVLCDQLETLPGPAGDRLLSFLRETRRYVHEEDGAGLERAGERELAEEVRRAGRDYEAAAEALEGGGRARGGAQPEHLGRSAAGTSREERSRNVSGGAQPERCSGEHRTEESPASTAPKNLRRAPHRRTSGEHRTNLLAALARSASDGGVELWTSSATHALLPLLASDAGLRLQLATGIASHERRFGSFGGGFWLPECAYVPGLERELADHGVRTMCVDQTDVHGAGAPEALEPVITEAGVVAVPIDWATVALVWDDRTGYPVHGAYRDYHHRTVHDLRPWSNRGAPYDPGQAAVRAREHARDFVVRCIARLDAHLADRGRAGLLCCAFDTELLGHWWYEGQTWLAAVLDECSSQGLDLVSISDGVERVGAMEGDLAASSWGSPKDFSTWDSPLVADLAFEARRAELRTVAEAAGERAAGTSALARAARELLALQSSDWAFQVTRDLASDYPLRRVAGHLAAHDAAIGALAHSGAVPDPALRNLAPDLDLATLLAP